MKKIKIVVLHGIDGQPGIHWQAWLAEQMETRGYESHLLRLPNPDSPGRAEWCDYLASAVAGIPPRDTILVGHSLGVATALDYVQRAPSEVRGLVSVSGFGRDYGADLNTAFMSAASIDFETVRSNLLAAEVLFGDNDPYVPQPELMQLATELRVTPHVIPEGGHLNTDSGYATFPRLLELINGMT